jgi:hypothetical protein
MAVMQTPHRFRTKRQLWNYCGLGLETHDSGEYRWSGQSSGLLFQKTMGAVTTAKWNHRGEQSHLRLARGDKAKPFAWRRPLSE